MTAPTDIVPARRAQRFVVVLGVGLAVFVLIGSYAWLALDHGTPWLWDTVVHESGRYTLGETVLYFSHFLREVPVALAYALFLLGASGGLGRAPSASSARLVATAGAAVLVVGALWLTARSHGWDTAWLDLAQYHTRDGLAAYGSHWHYHGLSTVWFGAAVGLAPAVLNAWAKTTVLQPAPRWQRIAWGYVLVLTIVFGVSDDMIMDVRYAGHQAREILTHGLVTLPLGLAALSAARLRGRSSVSTAEPGRAVWTWAVLVIGLPVMLAAVALSGDVMAAGQSDQGLAAMVAAHNFEHTLDLLFIALLLFAGVGAATRSST